MNWYNVFYLLTVSDKLRVFFDTTSNIFTAAAVVTCIGYVICSLGKAGYITEQRTKNEEEDKVDPTLRGWDAAKKFFTWSFYPMLTLALITWAGYVLTPSKKDCLMIIAGGAVGNFMASDSSAKQLPGDVTKFLHMSLQKEISDLGEDARKELGMQTPKEKLIDKAKNMSKEELINFLQSDTTITKNLK